MMRAPGAAVLGLWGLVGLLGGCANLADVGGTVGAVASGAATGNPAIAIGVGGAVRGGIDAAQKSYARANARRTHELITAVAAPLAPGEAGNWHEPHRFSSDVSGRVEVIRMIENKLATCKEVAFIIDGDPDEVVPYRGAICKTIGEWRWAMAEPSTERWSVLRN
jgi:ribosomal protein L32